MNVYQHTYAGTNGNGSKTRQRLSLSPTPEDAGWTVDGVLFQSCQSNIPGTVPLYQLYTNDFDLNDYLVTLDVNEMPQHYALNRNLGYVWATVDPSIASELIPIYRFVNNNAVHTVSNSTSVPGYSIDKSGRPLFYALSQT